MKHRTIPAGLATLLAAATAASAANWPQWRGPNFDGSSSETGLPATFSKTEGVKWTTDLPGPSAAAPIVWDDRVFVSSADQAARSLVALCVDRQRGKVLWRETVSPGYSRDDKSTFASASPVTDGKLVVFYYGNGALAAFDFAGKQLWTRNIETDYGQFAFNWTYSTSPLLHDGRLYIQVLQRDVPVNGRGRKDGPNDSYLLALDPQTGKELWRHLRPCDAVEESHESFSTPTPVTWQGRPELLLVGGDCITGHDPQSGRELWRWATWNPSKIAMYRLVPSAVTGGGVVLACAPKGAPIYAFKLGGKGQLDDSALAWKSTDREVSSDVGTPLFYQGRFYVLNGDRKTLARVDPATGKPDWIGALDSRPKFECSPTAADGKIYFLNHAGEVFVVAADSEFKLLSRVVMGEAGDRDTRSCVTIGGGALFIRTNGKLFCVGQ